MTGKLRTGLAGVIAGLLLLCAPAVSSAQLAVEHDSSVVTETAGNGDGVLDPGDSFSLTERVSSAEFDPLTGVTGTLATSSPGVALGVTASPWPDLTFASVSENATPFTGSLDAGAACGSPLRFNLTLATSAGTTEVPFTVPVGSAGPVTSRASSATPVGIPDGTPVSLPLDVAGAGLVRDVNVRVARITHPYVSDLRVEVVAPDGTAVVLMDRRGADGDDVVDAVFDQQATRSVLQGAAPFTGSWRPQGDLGRLEGVEASGTWRLRATDLSPGDFGSIDAWGADVSRAVCGPQGPPPPPPCARPHPRQPERCLKLRKHAG